MIGAGFPRVAAHILVAIFMTVPATLVAQRTITRAEAIQMALTASARGSIAASDTTAAAARLRSARAYPNPTISVGYSKAVPQAHTTLDLPLDLPSIRRARIRAAAAAQMGSRYMFLAEQIAIALDVDTLYVRAQVALGRRDVSAATARDAAQLVTLSEARRAAGDAADLDVELARISAAQASSVAAGDSADALDTILGWQAAMGVPGDDVRYRPTARMRSLADDIDTPPTQIVAPRIGAAEAAVASTQATVQFQHASRFGMPSLQVGFDAHDPAQHGLLPVVGIALPLPIFNHNEGEIAAAHADLQRAQAELTLAQLDVATQLNRAQHARAAALSRVTRDSTALASMNHVLTLLRTAYQEGEMTIADVLQAQRTYRDGIVQYQNDQLALFVNDAVVRALTGHILDSP